MFVFQDDRLSVKISVFTPNVGPMMGLPSQMRLDWCSADGTFVERCIRIVKLIMYLSSYIGPKEGGQTA